MKKTLLAAVAALAATVTLAAAPGTNGRIAFEVPAESAWQIALVNADGSGLRVLTADEDGALAPAWAPGSLTIAYTSGGAIRIVDLASAESAVLLEAAGYKLSSPAWSPDASKLAFIGEDLATNQIDLWVANADGTGLANLTNDAATDAEPAWTPDGMKVLFATNRDGNFEIYEIEAGGANAKNLTNDAADDRDPDVAPDGTTIVFVRTATDADPALWLMHADGTSPAALTDGTFPALAPAWSPDGTLIAFAGAPELDFEIWTIAPEGTGLAPVTGGEGNQTHPAWQSIVAGDNLPPFADAGEGSDVECTSPNGAEVSLDGGPSSDPDDTVDVSDIVLYEWFENYGIEDEIFLGFGSPLAVAFGFGEHVVTLQVTDSVGQTATAEVVYVVEDTTPPVIAITVTPDTIWPPNHKMVTVRATPVTSDVCSPPVTVLLESVVSSEPDDAHGSGNTQPDIAGVEAGTPDFEFQVRAERAGGGPGRIYTARYSGTDSAGNMAWATATITVPHDQRNGRDEDDEVATPTNKPKKGSKRSAPSRR